MIKINLLEVEAEAGSPAQLVVGAYVASLVLTLLICFFVYRSASSSIGELEASKAEFQGKLALLKDKTEEVHQLEADRKDLEEIGLAIGKLKLQQIGPVKLLIDLNSAMTERMWLSSVDDEGGTTLLRGIALDEFSIPKFLKNLEKYGYFKKIDVLETKDVNLARVASFNSMDSSYFFFIVPVEDVKEVRRRLAVEAQALGIGFEEKPPPSATQAGPARFMGAGDPSAPGRGGNLVRREPTIRRFGDKIYTWNISEGLEAIKFTVALSFDYVEAQKGRDTLKDVEKAIEEEEKVREEKAKEAKEAADKKAAEGE